MELKPGAAAVLYRTFSQRDFDRFAALSGDDNPIHVDPEFARRTRFGRTVCHGMLLYATICRALTEILGPGFTQREQELMFVTPTYTGEEVAVRTEVTALPAPGLADISTVITRPDGSVACQGHTVVEGREREAAKVGEGREHEAAKAGEGPEHEAAKAGEGAKHEDTKSEGREARGVEGVRDEGGPTTLKWLALGQAAGVSRVFSGADLLEYRDLSGDTNPAFSAPMASRLQTAPQAPGALLGGGTPPLQPALQVPGALLGGLFSFLLGTRLPGRGTNWLKQRLAFPAPCYAGQEVMARVEIVRLRPEKDLVNLRGVCTAGGQIVCEGESLVLVKDLEEHA